MTRLESRHSLPRAYLDSTNPSIEFRRSYLRHALYVQHFLTFRPVDRNIEANAAYQRRRKLFHYPLSRQPSFAFLRLYSLRLQNWLDQISIITFHDGISEPRTQRFHYEFWKYCSNGLRYMNFWGDRNPLICLLMILRCPEKRGTIRLSILEERAWALIAMNLRESIIDIGRKGLGFDHDEITRKSLDFDLRKLVAVKNWHRFRRFWTLCYIGSLSHSRESIFSIVLIRQLSRLFATKSPRTDIVTLP